MKDKYIKQLIDAHQRVIKILNQIPDDKLVNKKWTKKEVMAHLAGWYEEAIDSTPKILKGEKPISFKMSMDKFNQISVDRRKNKSVKELDEEMINLHQELIKKIESLDENQITGFYGTYFRKEPINIVWVINEIAPHDDKHAEELEKLNF